MTIKDKIESVMDKVTHKKPPHQSHTTAKTSDLTGSTTGNYATGAGGSDMRNPGGQDPYSLTHTGTTTKAASDYRHPVEDRASTQAYDSTAAGGGLTGSGQSYSSSSSSDAGRGTSGMGAGATAGALGAGAMGAGGAHSGHTAHLVPGPVEQTPGGQTEYGSGSTYGTSGATGANTSAYGTTGLTGGSTTDRSYGTTTGVTGGDTSYGTTRGVTGGTHTGVIDEREIIDSKTFTKTVDHEVLIEKKQYELEHRPVQEQYVVETRKVGEARVPGAATEIVGTEANEVDHKIKEAPRGDRTVVVQDVDVPLTETTTTTGRAI